MSGVGSGGDFILPRLSQTCYLGGRMQEACSPLRTAWEARLVLVWETITIETIELRSPCSTPRGRGQGNPCGSHRPTALLLLLHSLAWAIHDLCSHSHLHIPKASPVLNPTSLCPGEEPGRKPIRLGTLTEQFLESSPFSRQGGGGLRLHPLSWIMVFKMIFKFLLQKLLCLFSIGWLGGIWLCFVLYYSC